MFKEIFRKTSKEAKLVAKCFSQLDQFDKGISLAIGKYVVEDEDSSIPQRVGKLSKEQFEHAFVFSPRHHWNQNAKNRKEAEQVRQSFLDIYSSEILGDIESAKRWTNVMLCCSSPSDFNVHFVFETPDWIKLLVGDFMLTLHSEANRSNFLWPNYLNAAWLKDLLQKHDISENVLLAILLERTGYYVNPVITRMASKVDWYAILQDSKYLPMLDGLHFSGRSEIAKLLAKNKNLDLVVPSVMHFACDKSKQVREAFFPLFSKVTDELIVKYIKETYDEFTGAQKKQLAEIIAFHTGDESEGLLRWILEKESLKSVRDSVEKVLANKEASSSDIGSALELPDYISLDINQAISPNWLPILKNELRTQVENAKQRSEQEALRNKESKYQYSYALNQFKALSSIREKELELALKFLETGNGKSIIPLIINLIESSGIISDESFGFGHVLRIVRSYYGNNDRLSIGYSSLMKWIESHPGRLTDLRQLSDGLAEVGYSRRVVANWILGNRWLHNNSLPDTAGMLIWPFFAHYESYLEEAFGLLQKSGEGYWDKLDLGLAIRVTELFPVIPEKYLQTLYSIALSPSKTYGPLARKVLTNYGLSSKRVISAIASTKMDERVVAADWIAELKLADGQDSLIKALKKEKRETAKAAMLNALHALDFDISEYIAPSSLLKEAKTGLKKASPKGLAWFPFDSMPVLKWKDGTEVEAEILNWWIVLACKLKQPEGNPLISLYVSTLDSSSQTTLGNWIIQIFIERDTLYPSDDVAHEYAEANKQSTYTSWKSWAAYSWGEMYKDKTEQDAYQYLFNIKKSEYLTTAIGEKGILALASFATPADAVQLISRYMKDHYLRRHQIDALISSIANNDDPVVIQLILSIARRHRTKSVQEKARTLIDEIAERNGWSQDELADRTIPTAGLESDGKANLSYGSRNLSIHLGSDLKLILQNESGKVIKALPAPRQDDDSEQVKETKKTFSSSKKELKQVIDLQSKRLYESMCTERKWPYSEWKEFLLEHPIMRHLLQQLVWVVEGDHQKTLVRPTLEMELIDIDYEDIQPSDNSSIYIAHASHVEIDSIAEWNRHFKDEKLKPLFEQFKLCSHQVTEEESESKALTYRKGWVTEAFSIRGILTKLGYQRMEAEDAGFFYGYYKDFVAQNIRIQIEFSGNCLPEENVSAAITRLCFLPANTKRWVSESDYLKVSSIAPILLNEAMLDYEAAASKGHFDPDWKKKMPW